MAAALIAILLMGVLSGCWRSEPAEPEVRFTPIVGGAALATATPVDVAALSATETPSPAPSPAASWTPGQSVTVREEARLYAQPDPDALILETYGAGATGEILEPSGDFDQYPVEAGDAAWIRVRTADGLVGWVDVSRVTPGEGVAP